MSPQNLTAMAEVAKITPLVWENTDDGCMAHYPFGWYEIFAFDSGFTLTQSALEIGQLQSIEAAKSAAQADYEARISAALDVQPPSDGMAAALQACRIIDEVIREGHDNLGEMVLHFLTAAEPARIALAGTGASAQYGQRPLSQMMREWRALADACRAQGTPDIQAALEDCEPWIDFAFAASATNPPTADQPEADAATETQIKRI